jgi:plastocyanin
MRVAPRKLRIALLMVGLAAAGGLTAAIAQGDDPPATASFKTVDVSNVFQLVTGSGAGSSATIVTGGTVTFTNSSVETHNVDFSTPPPAGVSCQQTVGGPSPSAGRFPDSPTSGSWSGVCTFTRSGTYSFVCDHHAGMTGTIVVHDPAGPPGTMTSPVTTTTPTQTTPTQTTPTGGASTTPSPAQTTTTTAPATTTQSAPVPGAVQAPDALAKALAVRIGRTQRGTRVRGTISGAKSTARVKISLTARRGDLGLRGKAATPLAVGSLSALTTTSGALSFLIKLDGKARAALATRGRLAVTVRVTAPPTTGAPTPRTFRIVVRPVS